MATTFDVLFLGTLPIIDPTDGNTTVENAAALVGTTVGDGTAPLWQDVQSWSPGSTGFAGGAADRYDQNNSASSETFSIDGGPDQTFDALAVYNATIT